MQAPTISPHDPNVVLVHCDMTGAYITTDGGRSWRMFNLRTGVQSFAFDPSDPKVIYAGNVVLWRSEDTGRTWRMIWPSPARKIVPYMSGDHADYFVAGEDPSFPAGGWIRRIAVDPQDPRRVYVLMGPRRRPARLYRSTDRGATWAAVKGLGELSVHALHVQPTADGGPGAVFLLTPDGVLRLAGDRRQRRPAPTGGIRLGCAARNKGSAEPILYAATGGRRRPDGAGLAVSTDGGRSWRSVHAAIAPLLHRRGAGQRPWIRAMAAAERDGRTAYVSLVGVRLAANPDERGHAILKTTDAGKHWRAVFAELGHPSPNMTVSHVEGRGMEGYPNVFLASPNSLGVAPTDGRVCYATDLFRTYRTADGGRTWLSCHSAKAGPDRWRTRGLDVTTCYGVHFDPFDRKRVFITYTDIGLFRSEDGGDSWTPAFEGIPNLWRNTAYWLAFDPKVRGRIWGAFALNHDLPRPKMWRRTSPARYRGGVAVSNDGGRRWRVCSRGMPQTAVTHVLMDPTSPVGRRTLYACAFGRGVFKSIDNGENWTLRNKGIEGTGPLAWRLTRAPDGTLYLVVARRTEDGTIGNEGDGALYRSADAAASWTRIKLPAGCNGPNALTLDPRDPKRMYLSAWALRGVAPGSRGDSGGGVFGSTDAGATWEHLLRRAQHIYDVTVDPRDPDVLYCCGFNSSAYRSKDRGRTWERLRGYNFKWGHRVVLDPLDRAKIYITTFGGSVWHGPAAGDPKAVEDVLTPQLRLP
jgi:photosystem II stability/assembly factor-like uncharacterized protein